MSISSSGPSPDRIGSARSRRRSPRERSERFYGRRKGHPLSPAQSARLKEKLPALRIHLAAADAEAKVAALVAGWPAVWLEIGFGKGEHLADRAERNPEILCLGCEPFVNGVASVLATIETRGIKNIRIHDGDARELLPLLPEASLDRLYLVHPDPWPKRRHWKRRLVAARFLEQIAGLLKDGAEFIFVSDHADYVGWVLNLVSRDPNLQWTAENVRDWANRPDDWPVTRYEKKARAEGRPPTYLVFRREPRKHPAPQIA